MKLSSKLLLWVFFLAFVLAGYQHCGDRFKTESFDANLSDSMSSLSQPQLLLPPVKTSYPKIMSINIANPANYSNEDYILKMSRSDVLFLNFWARWTSGKTTISDLVKKIKLLHPGILVGQYTILSEAQNITNPNAANFDKAQKLSQEDWWLRNIAGELVQWTSKHNAYETNITTWTRPDKYGLRYPQWLANRDYNNFFLPTNGFDLWYFDLVLSKPAVRYADWNRNGVTDSNNNPEFAKAYRLGHVAEWTKARSLNKDILLFGNTDDLSSPEYSGRLQGALMEAIIGASWSTEKLYGWNRAMLRYRATIKHTAPPHIVGFDVHGKVDDYQRMRYGLSSCLLDDGYFSYSNVDAPYASSVWFDEFDADLGMPIELPPLEPIKNGVYRRKFERGMVLVNPTAFPVTISVEAGYRRIKGVQAPLFNNGSPVSSITLASKDGILLLKR
ncbi:MAG: hypothetical protein A4S09_10840 [Proteobacteria bacterium SG_bin7]|nr:MAG: hypothetical protein A4S09_10840 [Proteobacteria bacterium SG_bin7]